MITLTVAVFGWTLPHIGMILALPILVCVAALAGGVWASRRLPVIARFLERTPYERLQHFPRYLKAMQVRIDNYEYIDQEFFPQPPQTFTFVVGGKPEETGVFA